MSELKAHNINDLSLHDIANCDFYLKSEVDKVIVEKDEEIDELKERINELQKATDSAWIKVNAMYDELRHQKYKRCLNRAERYEVEYIFARYLAYNSNKEIKAYKRLQKWLELAETFKETKR